MSTHDEMKNLTTGDGRGMVCMKKRELRTLIEEFEAMRKLAIELSASASCHHLSHKKSERHELGESCKVIERIDAAIRGLMP